MSSYSVDRMAMSSQSINTKGDFASLDSACFAFDAKNDFIFEYNAFLAAVL